MPVLGDEFVGSDREDDDDGVERVGEMVDQYEASNRPVGVLSAHYFSCSSLSLLYMYLYLLTKSGIVVMCINFFIKFIFKYLYLSVI